MARIFPTELPAEWSTRGELAERETLGELRKLPDDYTVYYSQNWIDIKEHGVFQGEIDFVIVRDDGALILLEQKAGEVTVSGDQLTAAYGDGDKDVLRQRYRNQSHLLRRIRQTLGAEFSSKLILNSLLYFPNSKVQVPKAADIDPTLVHHDGSSETLLAFIQRNAFTDKKCPQDAAERLHRFFRAELNIHPSLTRAISDQQTIYRSMTGGVSKLLLGFEMEPLRLNIRGTAGSGKSQYGIALAERAAAAGKRVLYLCFNRMLADEVRAKLSESIDADTFHRFSEQLHERARKPLPSGNKGERAYYDALEASTEDLLAEFESAEEGYDLVVVDEGQDFKEAWFEKLKVLMRDEQAGMLWMEDPNQRVQRSKSFDLPRGFATWRLDTNFRTSRHIADYVSQALDLDYKAGSNRIGVPVERLAWADESEQRKLVDLQVRKWKNEGVPPEQIVILSMLGVRKSKLYELDEIGGYRLRKSTGDYADNLEQFTDGPLLLDTVRRFKGLESPCVIVTDIDPSESQEQDEYRRVLFVAMTRAMSGLAVAFRADNPMNKQLV
jgi:hypothetical protein